MARSSNPDTTTAILRESTQVRTSTATTPVTTRPIHQIPHARKTSVARSSSPDTITAILLSLGLQRLRGFERGGVDGCLGAAAQTEFAEDRTDVVLDRAHRVVKFSGDLGVGAALA
jgi:hypothetical protein